MGERGREWGRRKTTTVTDRLMICPAAACLPLSTRLQLSSDKHRISTPRQQHSVATVTLSGKDAPWQENGCRHFYMNTKLNTVGYSDSCITGTFWNFNCWHVSKNIKQKYQIVTRSALSDIRICCFSSFCIFKLNILGVCIINQIE